MQLKTLKLETDTEKFYDCGCVISKKDGVDWPNRYCAEHAELKAERMEAEYEAYGNGEV